MKTKNLNVRDMIFLAVLNVVAITAYAIIVALCCSTGIGLFFCTAVSFLILGCVYMLMVRKCNKKGAYIICGILMGFVGVIGGRIGTTIGCIAGGLIADFVSGNYKSRRRIVMGYVCYAMCFALGIYLPGLIFGANYLLERMASKGMEGQLLMTYVNYFNLETILLVVLLNIITAFLGALFGNRIVDKHFVKAGIISREEHELFTYERALKKSKFEKMRKRLQNPDKILKDYLVSGMKAADIGCGTGYFTFPMVKMVGESGMVYGIDIQKEMLDHVEGIAENLGCKDNIVLLHNDEGTGAIDAIEETLDFALLFAVAHEMKDRDALFSQLYNRLNPSGRVLLSEPRIHVSNMEFQEIVDCAKRAGFVVKQTNRIFMMRSVILTSQ